MSLLHLASTAIPTPSASFHTHETIAATFTWSTALLAVVTVAIAVIACRRHHTPIPLLLVIGGFAAALVEPMAATNGFVQYPDRNAQWVGLEAYNHPIPVFVLIAYGLEVGAGALLVWALMRRGAGGRAVSQAWFVIMIFDVVLESVAIELKLFRYYGHQPFDFWGMPLWWAPIDASICLLPGLAAYSLSKWGGRWFHYLAIVILFPVSAAAMYMGNGWPVFVLLNTGLPAAVVWVGGAVSVIISVAVIAGLRRVADILTPLGLALGGLHLRDESSPDSARDSRPGIPRPARLTGADSDRGPLSGLPRVRS